MEKNMTNELDKIYITIKKGIEKCIELNNELTKYESSVIASGYELSQKITDQVNDGVYDKIKSHKIINNVEAALRQVQFTALQEHESENLLMQLKISGDYKSNDAWMDNLNLLKEYMAEHGHSNLTKNEKYNGITLGKWILEQRKVLANPLGDKQKLQALKSIKIKDPEQIQAHGPCHTEPEYKQLIENSVFMWSSHDASWMYYFKALKKYYIEHGNCLVPAVGKTKSKTQLGTWVLRQRQEYSKNTLTEKELVQIESQKGPYVDNEDKLSYVDRIILLSALDFVFITDIKEAVKDQISLTILERIFNKSSAAKDKAEE
tara:strand:+ start:16 stop:972 length:957 start_codon:yes stop_codon:yes gene_type:complete